MPTPPPAPGTEPAKAELPKTAPTAQEIEADIAFWNSVKDGGKADELRAYLKKFPNGQFAELARLRIREAERPTGSIATPGTTAGKASAVMREVQERLYNLNFNITRFDGAQDEDTDRSIKAWQRRMGYAPSGVMTPEQVKALRDATLPVIWGAIALPTLGMPVSIHSRRSRRDAESAALASCREKHGVACRVYAIFETQCLAIATYSLRLPNGQQAISQLFARERGATAAVSRVMAHCAADPRRGSAPCSMVGAVCGNGAVPADVLKSAPPAGGAGAPAPPAPQRKPPGKPQDA